MHSLLSGKVAFSCNRSIFFVVPLLMMFVLKDGLWSVDRE